jgi:curved DNA binding protein
VSDSEEEELDISEPEVLAKYRLAAEIANRTMATIIPMCQPGARVVELCSMADAMVTEECGKVHSKGRARVDPVDKGVAFPFCVSVNHVVGHNSPEGNDEQILEEGDLVKLDLGVHIDGFIAVVANTVVATSDPATPITGRKADVLMAVTVAAEAALNAIKPGATNNEITALFERAANGFGVNVVEGVLSHQMKRHVIDANKVILSKETHDQKAEEEEIEELDVWGIDIIMSTGEGKPREIDELKTTIYKHQVDQSYNLKMKASREIFSQVTGDHPTLPFTLRQYEGNSRARLGMKECIGHDLFTNYPVLEEREGDFVAHAKFTVLLTEEGVQRVTGGLLPANIEPETQCGDGELMEIYQAAVDKAAKKAAAKAKKKKKK